MYGVHLFFGVKSCSSKTRWHCIVFGAHPPGEPHTATADSHWGAPAALQSVRGSGLASLTLWCAPPVRMHALIPVGVRGIPSTHAANRTHRTVRRPLQRRPAAVSLTTSKRKRWLTHRSPAQHITQLHLGALSSAAAALPARTRADHSHGHRSEARCQCWHGRSIRELSGRVHGHALSGLAVTDLMMRCIAVVSPSTTLHSVGGNDGAHRGLVRWCFWRRCGGSAWLCALAGALGLSRMAQGSPHSCRAFHPAQRYSTHLSSPDDQP